MGERAIASLTPSPSTLSASSSVIVACTYMTGEEGGGVAEAGGRRGKEPTQRPIIVDKAASHDHHQISPAGQDRNASNCIPSYGVDPSRRSSSSSSHHMSVGWTAGGGGGTLLDRAASFRLDVDSHSRSPQVRAQAPRGGRSPDFFLFGCCFKLALIGRAVPEGNMLIRHPDATRGLTVVDIVSGDWAVGGDRGRTKASVRWSQLA